MTIEDRLNRLERANRRWRYLTFLLSLTFMVSIAIGQPNGDNNALMEIRDGWLHIDKLAVDELTVTGGLSAFSAKLDYELEIGGSGYLFPCTSS